MCLFPLSLIVVHTNCKFYINKICRKLNDDCATIWQQTANLSVSFENTEKISYALRIMKLLTRWKIIKIRIVDGYGICMEFYRKYQTLRTGNHFRLLFLSISFQLIAMDWNVFFFKEIKLFQCQSYFNCEYEFSIFLH